MCGRYTIIQLQLLKAALGTLSVTDYEEWNELINTYGQGMYNISPSQQPPVIRRVGGKLVIDAQLKWGYDHPILPELVFNSKSEKINKGMFGPSFQERRCLVPASGFYDWTKQGQPYYFQLKSHQLFCFPGVWKDDRFSFATCEPNEIVRPIHHRMPVILVSSDQWREWLDRPAQELLTPLKPDLMEAYPIEKFGKRDSPKNIEPMRTLFG